MTEAIIQDDGRIPALVKYKNIFGKPNEGVHSYRIFGMAVVDIVMTIIGFALLSYWIGIPIGLGILGGFALGIIAHRIFGVRTAVDKWLFP